MGVDASIFARKAKRYFFFDRLSNIQSYHNSVTQYLVSICNIVYDRLMDKTGVNYNDVQLLALACKTHHDKKHHKMWCSDIFKFAEAFKGDEFFVVKDNDAYYEYYNKKEDTGQMTNDHSLIWTMEAKRHLDDDFEAYTEWEPPEENK